MIYFKGEMIPLIKKNRIGNEKDEVSAKSNGFN